MFNRVKNICSEIKHFKCIDLLKNYLLIKKRIFYLKARTKEDQKGDPPVRDGLNEPNDFFLCFGFG